MEIKKTIQIDLMSARITTNKKFTLTYLLKWDDDNLRYFKLEGPESGLNKLLNVNNTLQDFAPKFFKKILEKSGVPMTMSKQLFLNFYLTPGPKIRVTEGVVMK